MDIFLTFFESICLSIFLETAMEMASWTYRKAVFPKAYIRSYKNFFFRRKILFNNFGPQTQKNRGLEDKTRQDVKMEYVIFSIAVTTVRNPL